MHLVRTIHGREGQWEMVGTVRKLTNVTNSHEDYVRSQSQADAYVLYVMVFMCYATL